MASVKGDILNRPDVNPIPLYWEVLRLIPDVTTPQAP